MRIGAYICMNVGTVLVMRVSVCCVVVVLAALCVMGVSRPAAAELAAAEAAAAEHLWAGGIGPFGAVIGMLRVSIYSRCVSGCEVGMW